MSHSEMGSPRGADRFEQAEAKKFSECENETRGVTMRRACTEAAQYLAERKVADAAVDAWYLLEYVTGVSRAGYLADREKALSQEQWDAYVALIEKRGAHIPLQHLTGEQEFMGLSFMVNEQVLIPRQDTETLVELALTMLKRKTHKAAAAMERQAAKRDWNIADLKSEKALEIAPESYRYRVLDLCTGSGCIAISIRNLYEQWQKKMNPGQKNGLEMYASDISEEALTVARENARRLGADVHFMQSDLFDGIHLAACRTSGKNEKCAFNMIVSNPPYICTPMIETLADEVRLHEPLVALDGGEDGLALYRRLIRECGDYLTSDGWLLLEIGYDQGETVPELMRQYGFSQVKVTKDLAGNDRVVSGQRTKKGICSAGQL